MARGWESKSIEAQQADAIDKTKTKGRKLTPEAAGRARERETLRLARQQVLLQMKTARDPRHQKLLQDALADLDRKLASS